MRHRPRLAALAGGRLLTAPKRSLLPTRSFPYLSGVSLTDEIRASCKQIASSAEYVRIDLNALEEVHPGPPPALHPEFHYLEGSPGDVADYLLALNAINFGSGWFPTLHKRSYEGRNVSGYFTVAWALADHARSHGPPTAAWLRHLSTSQIACILEQRADHELMSLYAQALRELGRFLGDRHALDIVTAAGGSAERLAETLARGMAMFDDRGFYKRAQIVPNDLALAGIADFGDLDCLTIFADNLVPHVLRCEGVLVYDADLAALIDQGQPLPMGQAEREIRACALHACELISQRTGIVPRKLDTWLWTRGQQPQYKARPRHRCRTVFY